MGEKKAGDQNLSAIYECSEEQESRLVEGSNDFNNFQPSPTRKDQLSYNDANN